MPVLLAFLTVAAMAFALTFFLIFFAWVFVKIFRFKYIFPTAALFTCLEIIKGIIFTGFPWGDLSYNFAFNKSLIQLASVGGSYLITFFIFLINLLVFNAFLHKSRRFALSALFVLLMFLLFNVVLLSYSHENGKKIKIAVIQGNIPEKMKFDEKNAEKILNVYMNETLKVVLKKSDLIIWPESVYIKFLSEDKDLSEKFFKFLNSVKIPLILGIPSVDFINDEKYEIYNSLYFFINSSQYLRYDKIHLVPFGEYTPLKKLFFFVNKIVPGEDFSKGKNLEILKYNRFKIAPLICFEGIFPFQIMRLCKKGGNILVNISNEAWFGKSSALKQHLAANILRTVESGKYFIRCANTGISAIIEPNGKVKNHLDPFVKGEIIEDVNLCDNLTFYHKAGYLINFFYFIFALLPFLKNLFTNILLP
jgi:apolipoprotein N-acyltransferase